VTLLQLHNAVTAARGAEPTSVPPADILGPAGILEAFRKLQANGLVQYLGLTGIGQAGPLREVVASGAFDTIQTPYSLINPSAGHEMPSDFPEANYGNVIAAAARQEMGVFAIRVFAGGALLGKPPSAYTHKTLFFPLTLYERDARRAQALAALLPSRQSLQAAAVRFVIDDPRVASAIVGFREPSQLDEAIAALNAPPLSASFRAAALAGERPDAPNANPAF
jgi:aryl-alcohol dehydrogenase-like predicted oxidoreductase